MENISVELQTPTSLGKLIATADQEGLISFELEDVSAADERKIMRHLSKKRDFRIPQSNQIDDYDTLSGLPVDNETFFRLSLCTLWANTKIKVIW